MSVTSMTGFARADGEGLGISWVWEVKSVNGKSLDLRLRLAPGSRRVGAATARHGGPAFPAAVISPPTSPLPA